jgi:PAS domain S-box-containing protein
VDDFVSKPIVGPELVARVVSRLERLRYQQQTRMQSGSVPGLALRPQVKSPVGNTASSASTHQQPLATAHVNLLLVDDQPDNLRALSAILDGQHYKVRKAISGEIALDAIATLPPDVILLDVKMPEMNGYELCATLKASEKTRHIPVIFLSALDNTADKMKAFAVGGVDYITKPFQAEEVLARLKHQLMIRQQQRQLVEQNLQIQRTREILQESEARFRHAFDQLTIGIGFVGLDDRWLKVNPALCQLLGYAESELLSTPTAALIDAADVEQWQQSFQQLLQNQIQNQTTHYQLELRYKSKGDRTIWVSMNISLVRDGFSQPLYVLAQMQPLVADH